MSMYGRDPQFEQDFKVGDRMVITGMKYEGTINTSFGPAERTTIDLVTRDSYPSTIRYSALGAGFANLARRATAADFPHVAEYITVPLPGNKTVKRFAPVQDGNGPLNPREWVDGNDGDPIDYASFAPGSTQGEDRPQAGF